MSLGEVPGVDDGIRREQSIGASTVKTVIVFTVSYCPNQRWFGFEYSTISREKGIGCDRLIAKGFGVLATRRRQVI